MKSSLNLLKDKRVDKLVPKDDEYLKDGVVYCKNCHTPRSINWYGDIYRCDCDCQIEKYEEELQMTINYQKSLKIKELKEQSLLGKRYFEVTFKNTVTGKNKSFDAAFVRAKKYCDNFQQVLEKGLGIFFYGPSGVGKTHLTACMVNDLSNNLQECLLTNFFEISKNIRETFYNYNKSEVNYIDKITSIDFLFIDDLGTEAVRRKGEDNFLQEKIFEIINLRYNNLKPIIFSSNYSLQELITKQGFIQKTVDRIYEMCGAIIKIEGESYRTQRIKQSVF